MAAPLPDSQDVLSHPLEALPEMPASAELLDDHTFGNNPKNEDFDWFSRNGINGTQLQSAEPQVLVAQCLPESNDRRHGIFQTVFKLGRNAMSGVRKSFERRSVKVAATVGAVATAGTIAYKGIKLVATTDTTPSPVLYQKFGKGISYTFAQIAKNGKMPRDYEPNMHEMAGKLFEHYPQLLTGTYLAVGSIVGLATIFGAIKLHKEYKNRKEPLSKLV